VPPPGENSTGRRPVPLALLTRSELGEEFAYACRVALDGRRSRRSGGTTDWTSHPLVQAVLREITRRYYHELDEYEAHDAWISLC